MSLASLSDCKEQIKSWKAQPFGELITEAMQATVSKYVKVVNQCDKGLLTNTVLPLLADKVTTFKGMTPVVVALRNELLEERHWEQIQEVIHTEIDRSKGVFFKAADIQAAERAAAERAAAERAAAERAALAGYPAVVPPYAYEAHQTPFEAHQAPFGQSPLIPPVISFR